MITASNYFQQINQVDLTTAPEAIRSGHDLFSRATQNGANMQAYTSNATIERVVNTYLEKLNAWNNSQQKEEPKPKVILAKGTTVYTLDNGKEVEAELSYDFYEGDEDMKLVYHPDGNRVGKVLRRKQIDVTLEPVSKEEKVTLSDKQKKDITKYKEDIEKFADQKPVKTRRVRTHPSSNPETVKKAVKAAKKIKQTPAAEPATEPTPAKHQVEKIPPSVAFINRYRKMQGKMIPLRLRKGEKGISLVALFAALQKMIVEKVVTKTDKYADELRAIQKTLTRLIKNNKGYPRVKVELDKYPDYMEIVSSYAIKPIIKLAKRFIALQGKEGVKDEAAQFIKALNTNIKAGLVTNDDISEMSSAVNAYIDGKTNTIDVTEQTLNGLHGIAGIARNPLKEKFKEAATKRVNKHNAKKQRGSKSKKALAGADTPAHTTEVDEVEVIETIVQPAAKPKINPKDLPDIIGSETLRDLEFEKMGFTGKWLKIIGDPVFPFSMMIHAKPGRGKSSLAIELCHYLATDHNKRILYISKDEGNSSYTMQEKFERLNAFHRNIEISNGVIPKNINDYDFVVFDLMNDFDFDYRDFKFDYIEKYKHTDKKTGFFAVFKATADGQFRGNKDWENMFDISLQINDEGFAQASKNRFGAFGVIKYLQTMSEKVYKFATMQQAETFKTRTLKKDGVELIIVDGNDGRIWAVSKPYAAILAEQGFNIHSDQIAAINPLNGTGDRRIKTNLPETITSIDQAKAFLRELDANNESYDPTQNAHDLLNDPFTYQECEHLNRLMREIYTLPGSFDAYDFVAGLRD